MRSPETPPTSLRLLWTSDAIEAIHHLQEKEDRPGAPFRVDVRLGGCQGFKIYFELDTINDDDVVFSAGETRIAVQRDGLPLIAGGVLDYEDSHRGSGFRLANPQAEKACGCGQAFYADFEEAAEAEADSELVVALPQPTKSVSLG
jgi:iron-sulfur cluster assembly accessory protein